MSSVQFILLSGVIEGIFGAIFSLILIAVFLVGGTMLASWIFGSSIGSGYNRRNVIHPNDLPDLVKGLCRISERFKGKTKSEIENLSSIIYNKTDTTGYIVVSDQQANQFWIFPREGTPGNPHQHHTLKIIKAATVFSDGNEVTNIPLPGFPKGLFVAMSDDKTFQYYSWDDMAGNDLF